VTPSIAEAVAGLQAVCVERGITIAVAESLTAGAIQAAIGRRSGASDYFRGGVVTYDIDAKVAPLDVDRDEAEAVECVSELAAGQMAAGVHRLFGADFGLAVTGWAEADDEHLVWFPRAACAVSGKDADSSGSGWIVGPGATRRMMIDQVVYEGIVALTSAVRSL
jgi:nicotinamide-nucleotide amidase